MRRSSRRFVVWALALAMLFCGAPSFDGAVTWSAGDAFAQAAGDDAPKKRKKRRRKRRRKTNGKNGKNGKKAEATKAEPPPPPPPPPPPEPTEEEKRLEAEKARVEAAKKKREAEGRKKSAVTEGTPSRWSNRGAMVPVVAEVPITAPLPERNVPRAPGVVTPGQRLFADSEVISARLSLSGLSLATAGQDIRYFRKTLVDGDRDIELIRGRATMAYERIADSEFGVHLDLEYRPSLNTTRFTDQRVNELYVSFGMTDFRGRRTDLPFGLAFGRLAIREAGYAQADGLAFRLRVIDELDVGLFGGITGNPYGYNWALRNSEFVSADWYTGGAFTSLRVGPFSANVAGVVTYANPAVNAAGLDRIYASLDASYLVTPDLNFFATGIIDLLPSGQLIQNLEVAGSWSPTRELSLSAAAGRFSTVVYEQTIGYTYEIDPLGNRFNNQLRNQQIVDEQGNAIIPFDAAIYSTIYNQLRLRAGYRIVPPVEVYATVNTVLRDFSATEEALAENANIQQQLDATPFRMLPGAGVRYRDPDILDANFLGTVVIDERSNTDAILQLGFGRELFGLYGGVDGRYFLGTISGLDGGINLAYTFPRSWFPGLMLVRGTARYFRENVALVQPVDTNPDNNIIVPRQETVLLFAGIEYRL